MPTIDNRAPHTTNAVAWRTAADVAEAIAREATTHRRAPQVLAATRRLLAILAALGIGTTARAPAVGNHELSDRELEVLIGLSNGKSNADIGRELYVCEDTIKTHARRIYRKLGARDRAHAVANGFRTGILR